MLLHPAHGSERRALGAALLRMGAAEALHPLFLAGVSGTMQHVADNISMQAGPGRVQVDGAESGLNSRWRMAPVGAHGEP